MAVRLPLQGVMLNLSSAHWISRLIFVATKLSLADLLKAGPRTVDDLAMAAGAHAPSLYRVLRALASVGIFAEMAGRRFKLTPLAATLQAGVPGSVRNLVLFDGAKWHYDAWVELLHAVRTGESPFLKVHGVHAFEYLEQHPDDLQVFGEAMTDLSGTENQSIAAAYDFSRFRTLVDVAGGHGSLLALILEANRGLKGVLFEQPSVIACAVKDRYLTAEGVAQRCSLTGGDFFEWVPQGSDAYIMKHIIHDWDDEHSVKILANCRLAIDQKGKVLVIDCVIRPGNSADLGKLLDIEMLAVAPGGRERTRSEFAALFKQAGLKLTRVIPTTCPLSIVEGVRA